MRLMWHGICLIKQKQWQNILWNTGTSKTVVLRVVTVTYKITQHHNPVDHNPDFYQHKISNLIPAPLNCPISNTNIQLYVCIDLFYYQHIQQDEYKLNNLPIIKDFNFLLELNSAEMWWYIAVNNLIMLIFINYWKLEETVMEYQYHLPF
jgi:hypothetical protein